MILLDTSMYIAAAQDVELEKLLEELSQKVFIQSCDVVEKEIHRSSEFLRKTDRKQQAEELKLIYGKIHRGNITTTERIINLAEQYHQTADLSKDKHRDIENDFLIVASASVGSVKTILSLNRKTMASEEMKKIYNIVNSRNKYITPVFLTTREELSKLLKLP